MGNCGEREKKVNGSRSKGVMKEEVDGVGQRREERTNEEES